MMITPGATLRQIPVVSGDQKDEKLAFADFLEAQASMVGPAGRSA
jgi:hypothetical protein